MRYKTLQVTQPLSAFALGGRSTLQPGIPTDYPMKRLFLDITGCISVTVAGTAIPPESPFNIIERIRIFGHHRTFGDREILNLEGATLYQYLHFYGIVPPHMDNGGLTFNVGNYVFQIQYPIEFSADMVAANGKFYSLLDCPSYDNLQLEITWSQVADLVVGGTVAVLNAAAAGGSVPAVTLHREIPLLGQKSLKFQPGIVMRTFEDIAVNAVTLVDGLITRNIPRGNSLKSILIKTGTRAAGGGAWTTLSNLLLTRLRLKQSDQQFRDLAWVTSQNKNERDYALVAGCPIGYTLIDFTHDQGDLDDSLITVDYPGRGIELQLTGDVTAIANGRIQCVYTQIISRK